jgi:hypothetical protein
MLCVGLTYLCSALDKLGMAGDKAGLVLVVCGHVEVGLAMSMLGDVKILRLLKSVAIPSMCFEGNVMYMTSMHLDDVTT